MKRWIGRPPKGLRPFCQGVTGHLNSRDALPQDRGATGPRNGLAHQAEAECRGRHRQPVKGDARHSDHQQQDKEQSVHSTNTASQDDLVQISKTEWESTPATTIGKTTKVAKMPERRGWKSVLIRQDTFDRLKEVMKAQDKGRRTLDLAGIADGMVGHMLSDPVLSEAGIAEGRARKREEILAAANDWAD